MSRVAIAHRRPVILAPEGGDGVSLGGTFGNYGAEVTGRPGLITLGVGALVFVDPAAIPALF